MSGGSPGASSLFPFGQDTQNFQPHWGVYASVGTLPNTVGNILIVGKWENLRIGQLAYVTGLGTYQCDSTGTAGGGDAVWTATSAGPGGDHFAPKYLVGNVPAGDPNVPQLGAFVYIPDPGDGTGIEAALVAAAVTAGDVWIRPGTYNFQGGEVAGPLTIPVNVAVRGAGPGLVFIRTRTSGNQGGFILLAGASLEDVSVFAGAPAGGIGAARGVISVEGDGCLLRRLALGSKPNNTSTMRSTISLVAGGGGTTRTTTIEDITYSVQDNVSQADPATALEVVPGNGACIARIENFLGTGGDYAIYDPSTAGNGINQIIADRLTMSAWRYGGIAWNGVGVINTLSLEVANPDSTAVCVAIASRPGVPSTVLRDVWLDPKGTILIGIDILADVNGGVGLAPEIDGVTWSGNAAVSVLLIGVEIAAARGGVIRKVVALSNVSGFGGIGIQASNPDWTVEACTLQVPGTSSRFGIASFGVRTKVRDCLVQLTPQAAAGAGIAIQTTGAQSIVTGNNVITENAADVGIDGGGTNTFGNIVGNVLDMTTDANAFANLAVSCNNAANVVV